MSHFEDSWNPKADEVRAWGMDKKAPWPTQDFDLALAWTSRDVERACIELAANPRCPKQRFFLSVLYLMVGDAVRTTFGVASREDVVRLLDATRAWPEDARLDAFRKRSEELLEHPERFSYDLWCMGGHAR